MLPVRWWGAGRVGIPGGYQGGCTRVGNTGYPAMLLGEGPADSGAGPVGPVGAGVGGQQEPGERGG